MIKRHNIQDILNRCDTLNGAAADQLCKLFTDELSKYTALVAAAVAYYHSVKKVGSIHYGHEALMMAIQPFLPVEKKLSEKLADLAEKNIVYTHVKSDVLRQLADEVRVLEEK